MAATIIDPASASTSASSAGRGHAAVGLLGRHEMGRCLSTAAARDDAAGGKSESERVGSMSHSTRWPTSSTPHWPLPPRPTPARAHPRPDTSSTHPGLTPAGTAVPSCCPASRSTPRSNCRGHRVLRRDLAASDAMAPIAGGIGGHPALPLTFYGTDEPRRTAPRQSVGEILAARRRNEA